MVELLEARRRIAGYLALVVIALAAGEVPSELQQMEWVEAEREGQRPRVTKWRVYRRRQTPCHALKHPCGEQKSQYRCHSLLRTR